MGENVKGIFVLFILFAGCSTITEKECRKGDWYGLGIQDGSKGEKAVKYFDYEAACIEYRVKADRKRYNEGHKIGLKSYCLYEKGKELGLAGDSNHGLCDDMADFNKGYQDGLALYQREQEKKELKEQIISKYNTKECSYDAACRLEGVCGGGNICITNKGSQEALNYECTIGNKCLVNKSCKAFTEFTSKGDKVTVNLCEP